MNLYFRLNDVYPFSSAFLVLYIVLYCDISARVSGTCLHVLGLVSPKLTIRIFRVKNTLIYMHYS